MAVKNNHVYTAQELRQTAQGIFLRGVVAYVPVDVKYGRREKEVYAVQLKEMLLQAADNLEREKREIKELAVALEGTLEIIGNVGEYIQVDAGTVSRVENYREILAKAKEVCK